MQQHVFPNSLDCPSLLPCAINAVVHRTEDDATLEFLKRESFSIKYEIFSKKTVLSVP